jgi:hypothetical protein
MFSYSWLQRFDTETFKKYLSADQWFLLAIFLGRGIRWFRRSLSRSFERGLSRTLWWRGLSSERWSARLLYGSCGGSPRNGPCGLMLHPHACRSKFVLLYTKRCTCPRGRVAQKTPAISDLPADYRPLSVPWTYLSYLKPATPSWISFPSHLATCNSSHNHTVRLYGKCNTHLSESGFRIHT